MATTTTNTTTASTSPTATPAATPALAPLSSCPPVVGTIDVAALLEAGEAGGEDGVLGTGEPVSLLLSPPVVGTIDVRSCSARGRGPCHPLMKIAVDY